MRERERIRESTRFNTARVDVFVRVSLIVLFPTSKTRAPRTFGSLCRPPLFNFVASQSARRTNRPTDQWQRPTSRPTDHKTQMHNREPTEKRRNQNQISPRKNKRQTLTRPWKCVFYVREGLGRCPAPKRPLYTFRRG